MPDSFYGGLDFGTSGARISIINAHKKLVYSDSVPYSYGFKNPNSWICLLYTSPSPRDGLLSRMPSSA